MTYRADMQSRREEIEAKRQKLQALRRQRMERERALSRSPTPQKLVDDLVEVLTRRNSGEYTPTVETSAHESPQKQSSSVEYVDVGVETEHFTKKEAFIYDKIVDTEDLQQQKEELAKKDQEKRLKEVSAAIEASSRREIEKYMKELEELRLDAHILEKKKQELQEEVLKSLKEPSEQDSELLRLKQYVLEKKLAEETQDATEKEKLRERIINEAYNAILTQKNLLDRDHASRGLPALTRLKFSIKQIRSIPPWEHGREINTIAMHGSSTVAVVYGPNLKNPDSSAVSVVCIYDIAMPQSLPQTAFFSPFELLSVSIDPINPSLVVCGARNGLLVVFCRSLETSTKYLAHEGPVFALFHTSDSLVSAGTDGTLNIWLRDMLPELVRLRAPGRREEAAPLCGGVASGQIVLGCEDGGVYRVGNSGIDGVFCKPSGYPVCGLSAADGVFSTCGFDWAAHVWGGDQLGGIEKGVGDGVKPLASIERDDVLLDIAWRPKSQTFFSVGGEGVVNVFDLGVPGHFVGSVGCMIAHVKENEMQNGSKDDPQASKALTKVSLGLDGRYLVTGGLSGDLYIYEVEGELWEEEEA